MHNVLRKLARGHAVFELNEPQFAEPSHIAFAPIGDLSVEKWRRFDTPPVADVWPEVGSRAMVALAEDGRVATSRWIEVQRRRYRYLAAVTQSGVHVRMVLRDYLACEIAW